MTENAPAHPLVKRKGLKGALITIGALIALLVLARVLIGSSLGRSLLESNLEGRSFSGQTIEIDDLEGDILRSAKIGALHVRDADGVWLTLEGAEFNWSPAALLNKSLDISRIKIDRIHIARRPMIAGSQTHTDDKSPAYIRRIILNELDLPLIEIDVLNQERTLRATMQGQADATQSDGRLTLSLHSLDHSATDRADIDISWSDNLIATGKAEVFAPRGGLLLGLSDLPSHGDVSLHFEGAGDLDNWAATGVLSDANAVVFNLSASALDRELYARLDLNAGASALTQAITKTLGDQSHADIRLDFNTFDAASLNVDFRSDRISARIYGPLDLKSRKLAAPVAITARTRDIAGITGVDELSAEQFVLSGELQQLDLAWRFDGELAARALTYSDQIDADAVLLSFNARLDHDFMDIGYDIDVDALSTPFSQLDAVTGGALRMFGQAGVDLNSQNLSIQQAELRGQAINMTANGELSPTGPIMLGGQLNIVELERIAEYAKGAASFHWRLEKPDANASMLLKLDGATQSLKWLDPVLEGMFGDAVELAAEARLDQNNKVAFQVETNAAKLHLDGRGDYAEGRLDATANMALVEMEANAVKSGPVNLTAFAKGPLDKLELGALLNLSSLNTGGLDLDDLAASFDGGVNNGALNGGVSLTGLVENAPFSAVSQIDLSQGLELREISASWGELVLAGRAARAAGGDLTADLKLKGPLPVEDITGELDVGIRATEGNITVDGRVDHLQTQDIVFDDARFTLVGPPDRLTFSLDAKGQKTSGWPSEDFKLHAEGLSTAMDDARSFVLSLEGEYDGELVRTAKPIELTFSDQLLKLRGELELLGGRITARADRMAPSGQTDIVLDAVALDINRAATLTGRENVRGEAAFNARWTGRQSSGGGELKLEFTGLERVAGASPVIEAVVDLSSTGEFWRANLNITGEDNLFITGEARAPLTIVNGLPRFDFNNDPVAYTVAGEGRLGALWTLAGIETVELDGDFKLNARDRAPFPKMRPTGEVVFQNGEFEHAGIGLRLKDITLAANFDTQSVALKHVSANGVEGGDVSGRGDLNFDQRKPSSLVLDLNRLMVIKRTGQELEVTGQAHVEKAEKGATITGDLTGTRALLDITSFAAAQRVKTVNVRFSDDVEENAESASLQQRAFPVVFDLRIRALNQTYIRGAGLDVEMSADVQVRGRPSDLVLIGDANVVRGGFDLAGQNFAFDEGSVDFNGKARNALLDFSASRQSDGVTSCLGIEGSVSKPELALRSTPDLPEDEVLARLLFGRAAAELTALEAAQLAAAIAAIAGNGGLNPLNEIRDAFGLDRLIIASDDNGGTSVGAGKYLADDVYLEFRTSPGSVADVAVEWTPRDNVEIGTEFQQDGDARVTVQWKKDYGD